jgi:phospholipid/cholesterol/gamma-HCH transport system ATP-binding protein
VTAIRVEDVHKRYREPVLAGVSLTVPEGGIVALIGPGASGKSLLLKIIAGLVAPDHGRVFVGPDEITGADDLRLAEIRKRIGMLFQNYALFDFMTVAENIAFPLRRLYDMSEAEIAERVAERLGRVALPGFEKRAISGLSGGQKKRVGVARATAPRPPLLLYDEPTAGLDPVTSQKIYDLVQREQRALNSTALVVSSDVAGVLTIADRVVMLHAGRVAFEGTVDEARAATAPAVRQFVHGLVEGPL